MALPQLLARSCPCATAIKRSLSPGVRLVFIEVRRQGCQSFFFPPRRHDTKQLDSMPRRRKSVAEGEELRTSQDSASSLSSPNSASSGYDSAGRGFEDSFRVSKSGRELLQIDSFSCRKKTDVVVAVCKICRIKLRKGVLDALRCRGM